MPLVLVDDPLRTSTMVGHLELGLNQPVPFRVQLATVTGEKVQP